MNYIFLTATMALLFFMGCSNSSKEKELQEAFEIHQKSLALRENLNQLLQAENLSPDQKSDLQSLLEKWDANFVEVPGYEHSHDHHHGDEGHDHHHDHHHAHKAPELTAPEHLRLQQILYDQLDSIHRQFKK
ncbi:hypothetical protein [Lunatimonas lonarensis]|nr:hypothetical protein [Lunatimonas lonarensis]